MKSRTTKDMTVDADMGVLSTNIMLRRAELGISQTEVAIRMGLDRSVVSRFENGKQVPGAKNLQKLAAALETTPDRLLGKRQEDAGQNWLTGIENEIRQLPKDVQLMARTAIEGMIESLKKQYPFNALNV